MSNPIRPTFARQARLGEREHTLDAEARAMAVAFRYKPSGVNGKRVRELLPAKSYLAIDGEVDASTVLWVVSEPGVPRQHGTGHAGYRSGNAPP